MSGRKTCRYGLQCKNDFCELVHPTPGNASVSKVNKESPVCRYGTRCEHFDCKFWHPKQNTPGQSGQSDLKCRDEVGRDGKEPQRSLSGTGGSREVLNRRRKGPKNCVQSAVEVTRREVIQAVLPGPVKVREFTRKDEKKEKCSNVGLTPVPNQLLAIVPSLIGVPLEYHRTRERSISSSSTKSDFRSRNFRRNENPHMAKRNRMDVLEADANKAHVNLMNIVNERIVALESSAEFDIEDEKCRGTLEALKSQQLELCHQLSTYHQMKERARNFYRNEELDQQLRRELFRFQQRLPALAARPQMEALLDTNRFLIIQGQTGSGKSTQIAQYIADQPQFRGKRVICTQPRKIAAMTLATRVSFEYSGGNFGAKPGHHIGYHVGGRKAGGKCSRIEFVTEGVMLERIMRRAEDCFKGVGCIILDEAHERSIICDILLGLFKGEDERWKDIKIIVTSATIDLLEFSNFFHGAPTVEIQGRTFPVDLTYNPVPENCDIRNEVVQCALEIHKSCGKGAGDILCFLPGQEDVIWASETFGIEASKLKGLLEFEAFPLYGRQEPEEQAQVFDILEGNKRKVIFATDIAETSVTIDGVVFVVDSGVKKEMVFDPKRNISTLRVNRISRSSAIQRAGRSGRTQPGQCYRLYGKEDFESMNISTAPEIFRRPLSLAILSLREMNIDPVTFSWISAPSQDAFAAADEELRFLKAMDDNYRPTELGKLITQSQQEPKLVRMIYRGCQDRLGMAAITLASILTVSNIFFWNGNDPESKGQARKKRTEISNSDGDVVTMYRLFEQWLEIQVPKADAFASPTKKKDLTKASQSEIVNGENTEVSSRTIGGSVDGPAKVNAEPTSGLYNEFKVVADNSTDVDVRGVNVEVTSEDRPELNKETSEDVSGDVQPGSNRGSRTNTEANINNKKERDDEVNPGTSKDNKSSVEVITSNTSGVNNNEVSVGTPNRAQYDPQNKCGTKSQVQPDSGNPSPSTSQYTELPRRNVKKQLADWCRKNFINGKAMNLIQSTKSELLTLFKHTEIWKKELSQTINPSNVQLQRLVFSGYFLHTARLIHSKKSGYHQYFAVHAGVLGNLDRRAAMLSQQATAGFSLPQWIIYDKILRLTLTLFPVTSPIQFSWVEDESKEFYDLCTLQAQQLPTEKIIKHSSPECLRSIFGKYFCNMNILEDELDCSLDVDIDSGTLAAYCSVLNRNKIDMLLRKKIADAQKILVDQVVEDDYLGGTRIVLGQGYEVKDVLFPQEFTTLFLKKLPKNCSKQYLLQLADNKVLKAKSVVRSLEIIQHDTNSSAIMKFFSKNDAKIVLEGLKGEMIQGHLIEVTPTGLGPKKGVTQGETCRLKISWPIGPSTGRAHIAFSSPSEANTCIDNISILFPGSRVSRVHGELHANLGRINFVPKKPLPPAMFVGVRPRRRGATNVQNIRFITGLDVDQTFEYKITIVDLIKNIDEQELIARVKPANPKWVKVDRELHPTEKEAAEKYEISIEDRKTKLKPLEAHINMNLIATSDFLDKNLCRAGIYVYIRCDAFLLQKAFRACDFFGLGDIFGQPHRCEIEYNHVTSVHLDLYKYLKPDIDRIRNDAYKQGVTTSESRPKPNGRSMFATLRFRSCNVKLIQSVQSKLEELSNCSKFVSDKIHLLFSWTGRIKLEEFSRHNFIHWNGRAQTIWIYGSEQVQKEAGEKLNESIKELVALEILDQPVMLCKKKIDLKKKSDTNKISRICTSSSLAYYHFNGNRIFASGSTKSVAKLEELLEKDQFLFKKRPSALAQQHGRRQPCGLCFDVPEGQVLLTSLCGHSFCMDCIQPMFDIQPPVFPVKCPECQSLLVINDILKCTTLSSLRKFLEVGVFEFQKEHGTEVLLCPKPGCNQLFSSGTKRTGEFGGEFYFCDECVTTYCMPCSDKLGKPRKSHEYDSCEDAQNGPSEKVLGHIKEIHEQILNLACPSCKTVFYEFDGCAAVACGSCNCHFCGICLKDCGSDAHPHVMNECTLNPRKSYYISEAQLNQIHQEMRQKKLKEYIDRVEDGEVRQGIHRAIRKDLIDLGIDGNVIGMSS